MKKNKKDPKKHGVISIVQSPDRGKNTSVDVNTSGTENTSDNPEEQGIISVVQSPDKGTTGKTNK
jgi:hypothetical protein